MAIAFSLKATQPFTFDGGSGATPIGASFAGTAFTPSNNSLLFAVVHCLDANGSAPPTFTITDSLSGTWTLRQDFVSNSSAFATHIRVFTRPVTTGASMTCSFQYSGGSGIQSDGASNEVNIFECTGHDTVSGTSFLGLTATHADTTTTGVSFSLGGTSAASSMVLSFVDGDGNYGDPVIAEGSGWTSLYKHVNGSSGGWHRASVEYKSGAISTILWGASTSTYNEAYTAMEIIAAPGITRVQGVDGGNSGATNVTSVSVTLSAVGSGNAICGIVDWGGGGGTLAAALTSVTDDKGNTYNLETPRLNVVDDQYFSAFSRTNITNAPTVFTATFSGSDAYRGIMADEFSGISTASTDERDGHGGQYQSATGTSTDGVTSGSFTTTVNGDLLYGTTGIPTGTAMSAGTGFTSGLSPVGRPVTEYRVQATAGAGTAATFTAAASIEASTFLIALKPAGAGGPSTFNQTVNITATTATTLKRAISKALGITGTSTTSIVKAIAKALGITGTSTTSVLTTPSIFSTLVAPLLGRPPIGPLSLNPAFRIRSTFNPASLPVTGTINPLTLTISCVSALTKLLSIGKPLAITATSTTIASALRAFLKTLTITATSTTTASRVTGKQAPITATSTTTVNRAISKFLSIVGTSTTTINAVKARLITLTITATSAVARTMQVGKVLGITGTSTTSVSMVRALSKAIAITCTSAVSRVLAVSKLSAITATSTTTISAIKARILTLAITCTSATTRGAMQVGKRLGITGTSATSSANSVAKRLSITATSALSSIKGVAKRLAITATSTTTGLTSRAFLILASITATSAVTARRGISKAVSVPVSTTVNAVKAISRRISIVCSSALSAIAGRGYRVSVTIIATTSTFVSAALVISATVGKFARRIVGMATQPFIIGRATEPATITGSPSSSKTIVGSSLMTTHDIIDFVCGDTWELTGPLQNANGDALNLTGASITWKLDTLDGVTNKITLTLGNGITVIDAPTATVLVKVPTSQTNTVAPANYKDWLRVSLADGQVFTEWTGVIRVTGNPA